jgi:N-acetylmuramoyl-L-alanine amidase
MILCIDAGHGGIDGGATGFGKKEKNINLTLALAIGQALEEYNGAYIIYTRTTDKYLTLTQRCNIANKANANLFVSIHCNADKKKASGFESYCYYGAYDSTQTIRQAIHDKVAKIFVDGGIPDRGKKFAGFTVLQKTAMPAILFENGFIDFKKDNDFVNNKIFTIANAYAEAIAQVFKLTAKKQTYIVQKGDTLWSIARKAHPDYNNTEVAGYVNKIMAVNKVGNLIYPNQKLLLP